jgi:hypothetical protein
MTTEERLEKLERELKHANRHNQRLLARVILCLGIGITVLVFGLAAMTARAAGGAVKQVRATEFILEDENGIGLASLTAIKGFPSLLMRDKTNNIVISLSIAKEGPALVLNNKNAKSLVGLAVQNGEPWFGLSVGDDDRKGRVGLFFVNGKPTLTLIDMYGKKNEIK